MKRVLVLFVLAAVQCKKTPEPAGSGSPLLPAPQPVSSAAAPAPAPTPTTTQALPPVEITWVDPPEWKRSEHVSPMRKATYLVPRAAGDSEDGELGVFYFGPGQGGGIEANVDRWVKQFTDVTPDKVKREDRKANDLVEHLVEIDSGTFNASVMSQGAPKLKKDHALLGAIVEAPSGAYFFKLTGPKATVKAAKKPFLGLLDSVKAG